MKNTQFYISLPVSRSATDIPGLIRHAAQQLHEDVGEKPITISHFTLVQPYINNSYPSIFVDYVPLTRSQINQRQAAMDSEEKKAEPLLNLDFVKPDDPTYAYGAFRVRLPQGHFQANSLLLLETTALAIEKLGSVYILDLVYHDYCDEDGINHPYVNVYFARDASFTFPAVSKR